MRILLTCISLLFILNLSAQQIPHYSQYTLDPFLINPGVAGTNSQFQANLHYRAQWTGIQGAPNTGILSVNGPLQQNKMGIGGFFYRDEAGPATRTGGQLAYSYQFRVTEASRISLGLSLGMLQYRIDQSQLVLFDQGDEAFMGNSLSSSQPDAGFGAYYLGRKYAVGISGYQLIHAPQRDENAPIDLNGHYFLTGHYSFALNKEFRLTPSALVKYVNGSPLQLNIGGRLKYKDQLWGGVFYRTNDAVTAMAGYTFRNKWTLSYAYDLTTSALNTYSSGTHEIMIGYRFNKKLSGLGNKEKDGNEDE